MNPVLGMTFHIFFQYLPIWNELCWLMICSQHPLSTGGADLQLALRATPQLFPGSQGAAPPTLRP